MQVIALARLQPKRVAIAALVVLVMTAAIAYGVDFAMGGLDVPIPPSL